MLNNARAESDAMSSAGRNADGKLLTSTERGEYDMGLGKRDSPMSDGDGSAYEDDLESLKRRHAVSMSRGSV